MSLIFKKRVELVGLTLILLIVSFRFYKLDGGLVLGEPDEFIHQQVVENLRSGGFPWPVYAGVPWFFQMPLYPYLGYLFSFFFPQPYVGLRVISVLTSLFMILGTYFFFRVRFSKGLAFVTALFLALSPFSIYISRLALLDSGAVSFGMLALYSLDLAWSKKSRPWALAAGFFLTLSIMFKYTGLIYIIVLGLISLLVMVRDNFRTFIKDREIRLNILLLIPLVTTVILILPFLYLMRQHDSYTFKIQFFTSLGFLRDFWRVKGGELNFGNYLPDLAWWLTLPVLVSFSLGLVIFFRKIRAFPFLSLGFFMTAILTLTFRPFYPRYFYPIVPFLVIFNSFFLWRTLDHRRSIVKLAGFILVLLLTIPTSIEAFRSTNHSLIEKTGKTIQSYGLKNPWIFANYWPNVFGQAAFSNRATWLTASAWDAKAFIPEIEKSPLEILDIEGGFALVEEKYSRSRMFIHNEERFRAWKQVEEEFVGLGIEIVASEPNFPHLRSSVNRLNIYPVKAGRL